MRSMHVCVPVQIVLALLLYVCVRLFISHRYRPGLTKQNVLLDVWETVPCCFYFLFVDLLGSVSVSVVARGPL